jgi:hypothetical protein
MLHHNRLGRHSRTEKGGFSIEWHRLARRAFLSALFVFAGVQLYYYTLGHEYGLDFLRGTWYAGHAVLRGQSPYPAPATGVALRGEHSMFMTPPVLALIGVPFSLLPFGIAITAFNILCAGAVAVSLRLLGVADKRLYLLALCSFPVVISLADGQPDGVFTLAAACAWQWRNDRWRGAVAAGALIAAKLLAWPLVLWLLITRRYRQAAVSAGSAALMLIASWACIGFKGMTSYLRLLSADAQTYEYRSHSLVAGFMQLGFSAHVAVVLMFITAGAVAAAVVWCSRGSDAGWFTAAVAAGVLSSPIVWEHYLVCFVVCVAATRRPRDPLSWLLITALWIYPHENSWNLWEAWLVPVFVCAIACRAGVLSRANRSRFRTPAVIELTSKIATSRPNPMPPEAVVDVN